MKRLRANNACPHKFWELDSLGLGICRDCSKERQFQNSLYEPMSWVEAGKRARNSAVVMHERRLIALEYMGLPGDYRELEV